MDGTSLEALVFGLIVAFIGAALVRVNSVILNVLGVLMLLAGVLNFLGAVPAIESSWIAILLAITAMLAGVVMMRDGGSAKMLKTVLGLIVALVGLYALIDRLDITGFFGVDLGDILQDGIDTFRRLWNSAEAGYEETS